MLDFGRAKLHRKGCDLLVVNQVGTSMVFGQDTTEVTVLSARGAEDAHASGSKAEVAQFIMARVGVELGARSDG